MNKALELLEQYCQWIAIALGGVFLALMTWWYLLGSPVAVGSLTPATVDETVKSSFADPLSTQITREDGETPPARRSTTAAPWEESLRGTKPALAVRNNWSNGSAERVVVVQKQGGGQQVKAVVTELAKLPPSEPLDQKAARVYAAPFAAAPPAGLVPAGAPANAPAARDISYVRVTYSLNAANIDAAFAKIAVPENARSTSVLGVRLLRQEKLPDGTWGAATDVPYLNATGAEPLSLKDAAGAGIPTFLQWAESQYGQATLLQPPFYAVLMGEGPWDQPADDLMLANLAAENQRKLDAQRLKAEEDRRNRARQTGPRAPGGGGGSSDPGPGPRSFVLPLEWSQVRRQPPAPVRPPAAVRPPSSPGAGEPGGRPGNGLDTPAAPGVAGAPVANPNTLPNPIFNPVGLPPLTCWAYDDTVVEGRTYRYQVLYALKNPMFDNNIASPEVMKTFAIWSEVDEQAWTQPVTVKPSSEYFVANGWGNIPPSLVKIDVFKWTMGKWQSKTVTVAIGDSIGTKDDVADFQTNNYLVDVRFEARQDRAVLLTMDTDGHLTEREPKIDKDSKRYKLLQDAVIAGKGLTVPTLVPGAAPGMPGPGGQPAMPAPGGQPVMPGGDGANSDGTRS